MTEEPTLLYSYIRKGRWLGLTDDLLKRALLQAGWPEALITEALTQAGTAVAVKIAAPASAKKSSFFSWWQDHARWYSLFLCLVIILVIVAAAGSLTVLGYLTYANPRGPARVENLLRASLGRVESFSYQLDITTNLKQATELGGESVTVVLPVATLPNEAVFEGKLSGTVKLHSADGPQASGHLALRDLSFQADEPLIDIEWRLAGGELHNYIQKIPGNRLNLTTLTNQWLIASPETAARLSANVLAAEELVPQLLRLTNWESDELIGAVATRRYHYLINQAKLEQLLLTLATGTAGGLTKEDAALIKQLAAADDLGGTVWLGKKDWLPRRLSFTAYFRPAGEARLAGELRATLNLTDFNQPLAISAPLD